MWHGVKSNLLKSTYPACAQPTTASIFPSSSASFSLLDFSLCSSISLQGEVAPIWMLPLHTFATPPLPPLCLSFLHFKTERANDPNDPQTRCWMPSFRHIFSQSSGALIYLEANLCQDFITHAAWQHSGTAFDGVWVNAPKEWVAQNSSSLFQWCKFHWTRTRVSFNTQALSTGAKFQDPIKHLEGSEKYGIFLKRGQGAHLVGKAFFANLQYVVPGIVALTTRGYLRFLWRPCEQRILQFSIHVARWINACEALFWTKTVYTMLLATAGH